MKMILKTSFICLFIFSFALCNTADAYTLKDTTYITEDLPPYNYVKNGKPDGASVQILIAALAAVGIDKNADEIRVYPWARGLKTTLAAPNTCLFSTVRNKDRETLFKWAGPIADVNLVFVSLKNTVKIDSLNDLEKVKVSAIRKGIGHHILISKGVPEKLIDLSPTISTMIEKLKRGRVDAILENENVIYHVLRSKGLVWHDFNINYMLNLGEIYFAFNLNTPDSIVSNLQRGIDKIRANGTLKEILEKLPIDKN